MDMKATRGGRTAKGHFTMTRTKTALLAAFAVVSAFAATAPSANAFPIYPHHHHGWGYGAAGLGLGLVTGAMIASAANAAPAECWVERRLVDTEYGPRYRRVRICN
jgi:hypothetical protein